MADRHKRHPKAVRMPGGLQAWYEAYADEHDLSVNAALVAALEEFRQRHDLAHPASLQPPATR